MKYEITDSIKEVIGLMKQGWIIKRDISGKYPNTYLIKGDEIKNISEWTSTVLWNNGLLICDGKYPIASYKLKESVLLNLEVQIQYYWMQLQMLIARNKQKLRRR